MSELIRVVLGRLIGAGVGAAAGFAASKGIHTLSPDCTANLTTTLTNAAMLAGYGVAHKIVNRKVNPADHAAV